MWKRFLAPGATRFELKKGRDPAKKTDSSLRPE
jgi:hypothetical protein